MQKAQAALEFLIAAFIAITLLLVGIGIYTQQSMQSEQLTQIQNDLVECNKLADAVSILYTSEKQASTTIFVSRPANFKRQEAQLTPLKEETPGQITVGNYYCYYFGRAVGGVGSDKRADNTPTGFDLPIGNYIIEKMSPNGFIMFTKQA